MKLPTTSQLTAQIARLASEMADPAVSRNVTKIKQLTHEHANQQELLELVTQLEKIESDLAEARTLLASDDTEMQTLAQDDEQRLIKEQARVEQHIEALLIPRDPLDDRNVILEIRAGAGGEEAALFALELFRAYARYGELHGWHVHIVSSSKSEQGGFKEVVAEITGPTAHPPFGILKFERGVHRVQRVPETEKQGRIHTSTVTVAVLPQAEETDIEIKPEDLRIDTYRASGAGGQHVNKTSSAIRITHLPTNTVVAVQEERSQHKNRAKAMSVLRSRLLEAQEEAKRSQEARDRKKQVGTGDRSEKIRTYNFPQDRITDHRIKESWSNIPGVMDGNFEPLFKALQEEQKKLITQN